MGCKVQLHILVMHPGQRPKVGDRQSGWSTVGRITLQGRYGNREGLTGTLKWGGKRRSGEAAKANPLRGRFIGVTETKTMENFARSLLQVEMEQGSLKPNYDHQVRTRMKRSPRMKLFSPKFRSWTGQWNVRTLYESGKVAELATEMRRYRLEILGVSEARWNQFGETELATGELFIYRGKENKDNAWKEGKMYQIANKVQDFQHER